jgi:hypothetical protein
LRRLRFWQAVFPLQWPRMGLWLCIQRTVHRIAIAAFKQSVSPLK